MTKSRPTCERELLAPAPRGGGEQFDWAGLRAFVVSEIVATVVDLCREHPGQEIPAAAMTDFYAQDMLILWPTISVANPDCLEQGAPDWRTRNWPWHVDPSRAGDEWAARLTAHAGIAGRRWQATLQQFFDTVVEGCRDAAAQLSAARIVGPDFVVVPIDEQLLMAQDCLSDRQLRYWFPDVAARRTEIAALRALPVRRRIPTLLELLAAQRSSALDLDTAGRMLAEIGEPAALALARFLRTQTAGEVDTETHAHRYQRCFDVLDTIASTAHEVLEQLLALLGDPTMSLSTRTRAASSLAWAGQLDTIADELTSLPDELACTAIARPYLSATKNGPLDYRPAENLLGLLPHLDAPLVQRISPAAMFEIDNTDIDTAVRALSSPSSFVRRHAATVLLTTHL